MDIGMTLDELAARMPLEQFIPITEAAKILGGGKHRINSLMDLAMTGGLYSWSHSCPYQAPAVLTIAKIGLEKELPNLTPDTDPATVMIESKEALWRWCVELESLFLGVGDENLPPRDKVAARFDALNARSIELKTGSRPPTLGSADSGTPAPEKRPPTTKEHNAMLRIIIGMAIDGYGYAPKAGKSTLPKELEGALAQLGISLTADTIRKYLQQAANTVLPQNGTRPPKP